MSIELVFLRRCAISRAEREVEWHRQVMRCARRALKKGDKKVDIAEALGITRPTLDAWLAKETSR